MDRVAVIGAGPAGMAAAIQLARAGIDVDVFEKHRPGGALWNAGHVENYPGFPGGISGAHLARLMVQQLFDYIEFVHKVAVEKVRMRGRDFEVAGEKYDGVIVATGTEPKKAGFAGEDELSAAGKLLYGIEFLEHWHGKKDVAVIGGGEASMDMALSLYEAGMNVTLIYRSEPRGILDLLDTAKNEDEIEWVNASVKSARLHEEKAVVILENEELAFDYVIVAVGREKSLPELVGFESRDGFYIVGDAARGKLGQCAMAVGDGIQAAMELAKYLEMRM